MKNSKLLLKIHINITDVLEVSGTDLTAKMILFDGYCSSPLFTGKILPGAVDTQKVYSNGATSLSARYILEGKDETGKSCRLFIENIAITTPGEKVITRPQIYTDSKALKWLETESLYGEMANDDEGFSIIIMKGTQE